jgi:hypothetical protein
MSVGIEPGVPGCIVALGCYEICIKTERGVWWCEKYMDNVSLAVFAFPALGKIASLISWGK